MKVKNQAKVSVCMTAYNQENYIADAIEGVLSQKTTFPIELNIGDDCSTDRTGIICQNYASRFPEIVNYRRRETNLGLMPNLLQTLSECHGKYIAICEGDDYWIDENKLQTQFDFMELHEDFSLSCHNHLQLSGDKFIKSHSHITDEFRVLETEDYMRSPHFQTASYFLRRSSLPDPFPIWYKNVLGGDHFLVLFLSLNGKIGFFNKRMSVFRIHNSSTTISKGALKIKENFVHHLMIFNIETGHKFNNTLEKVIQKWNIVYKVYEPIGYFPKLSYFIRNIGFYLTNFGETGGLKLAAKYLLTLRVFDWLKRHS